MPYQEIDVTGDDWWKSDYWWDQGSYYCEWTGSRWDFLPDYNGVATFSKVEDYHGHNTLWDSIAEQELYGLQITRHAQEYYNAECNDLLPDFTLNGSTSPDGVLTEISTGRSYLFEFNRPILVKQLWSVGINLAGNYYWGPCGQSYVSEIKLLLAPVGDEIVWYNRKRTAWE
jgi:hypothetical protein